MAGGAGRGAAASLGAGVVSAIAEVVERFAARPFLVDAEDSAVLTYAEADARARALAAGLRAEGLGAGDRLLVARPNGMDLALLYLAALHAEVVVVPLGPGHGARELRAVIGAADAAAAVVDATAFPRVARLAAEHGVKSIEPGAGAPLAPGDPEGAVAIHFTSGTSGTPQGVAHTLSDFLDNARRLGAVTGLDADHRFHSTLPMTYLGGYYNLLLLPFAHGASVVIDRAFDARSVLDPWDVPIRCGVNALWFVPTMMSMLLQLDRGAAGRRWCRGHVRTTLSGMAPLRPDVRADFEREYGVTVLENYGLAETLFLAAARADDPPPPGVIGPVLDGVALRTGGDGAIQAATPDLMVGAPLADGRWYDTGDLGEQDAGGAWRITGRVKEIVIRGGINLSLQSIDDALAGVEGVARVAAVAIPHAVLGEEPCAVVVCAPGHDLDAVEPRLRAAAAERLDPTQHPAVYVQIDELPVTVSGKVRRARLQELVVDRLQLAPRQSPVRGTGGGPL
jgi:acyl-CoA synthetase (AMP-forming)/AMP-acid ligase II